jgi:hypothetical protein
MQIFFIKILRNKLFHETVKLLHSFNRKENRMSFCFPFSVGQYVGCSFKFFNKVGVESIVNAPRKK